jgi:hypothetical protein
MTSGIGSAPIRFNNSEATTSDDTDNPELSGTVF